VARRHPDVDDRQFRPDRTDQFEQFRAISCLAGDLVTRAVEQAGQALAQQDIVVG
jgi:hypothetical protein